MDADKHRTTENCPGATDADWLAADDRAHRQALSAALAPVARPLAGLLAVCLLFVAATGTAAAADDAEVKAWMKRMEKRIRAAEQDAQAARRRARRAESQLQQLRRQQAANASSSRDQLRQVSSALEQRTGVAAPADEPAAEALGDQVDKLLQRNRSRLSNVQKTADKAQKNARQAQQYAATAKKKANKADRFSFSAYARSGFLTRPDGSGVAIFDQGGITPAGSSGANTGRLGIENDNYFEGAFGYAFDGPEDSSGSFTLRLSNTTYYKTTYPADHSNLVVRELFSQIKDLPSFNDTAFSDAAFWAGLRYAPGNEGQYSLDSDYVFLSGTGGGVSDVALGDDTTANFSLIVSSFDSQYVNSQPYVARVEDDRALDNYVHSLIFTGNFFRGPYQLMLNGIRAIDNDKGDPAIYADRATLGFTGTVAYDSKRLFGFDLRNSRTRYQLQGGTGLGAEVRDIGSGFSAQSLTKDAWTVRATTGGFANLSKNWKLAPVFMTQYSKNRYYYGDEIYFATLDMTLVRRINRNFEIKFASTYQWDYVKVPQQSGGSKSTNGNYYKFTIAPTLKLDTSGGFLKRPELRLLASYINFSDSFSSFRIPKSAAIDDLGFGEPFPGFKGTSGGDFVFGIQSEVFF